MTVTAVALGLAPLTAAAHALGPALLAAPVVPAVALQLPAVVAAADAADQGGSEPAVAAAQLEGKEAQPQGLAPALVSLLLPSLLLAQPLALLRLQHH